MDSFVGISLFLPIVKFGGGILSGLPSESAVLCVVRVLWGLLGEEI